ncbi:MAG TPA: hypothetical protein VLL52_11695 [Anaerolineae bacterium]|nr:hypothetical protein [Anaerolineae bacterium]
MFVAWEVACQIEKRAKVDMKKVKMMFVGFFRMVRTPRLQDRVDICWVRQILPWGIVFDCVIEWGKPQDEEFKLSLKLA